MGRMRKKLKDERCCYLIELSLGERFEEVVTLIFEYAWFYDEYTVNGSVYYFHIYCF